MSTHTFRVINLRDIPRLKNPEGADLNSQELFDLSSDGTPWFRVGSVDPGDDDRLAALSRFLGYMWAKAVSLGLDGNTLGQGADIREIENACFTQTEEGVIYFWMTTRVCPTTLLQREMISRCRWFVAGYCCS